MVFFFFSNYKDLLKGLHSFCSMHNSLLYKFIRLSLYHRTLISLRGSVPNEMTSIFFISVCLQILSLVDVKWHGLCVFEGGWWRRGVIFFQCCRDWAQSVGGIPTDCLSVSDSSLRLNVRRWPSAFSSVLHRHTNLLRLSLSTYTLPLK